MRIGIKQTGGFPYMGIMAQVQEEAANGLRPLHRFPVGHGVAWVHGYDAAPTSNLGGGMTLHMGKCTVLLLKTSYRQLSNSK